MKNLFKTLVIISISIGIFSCSKKVTTFNFGKPYHDQQEPLVKESVNPGEEEIITASTPESPVVIQKQEIIDIKPAAVVDSKKIATVKAEKPTFKERIVTKMLKKKIAKIENKQDIDNNMKIGIVIAAVSLVVLIVVAAGLLGGLSSLFWLLGGLGLLTGLIIILLSALDVI